MSGTSVILLGWMVHFATVVLLVTTVTRSVVSQPPQCGTVGCELQEAQTKLTNLAFYLNTLNPAPCSGNVTTWEYCYYQRDVDADEYMAPFGIYRLNGSNYELISEMFLIIISEDDIGSDSFTCQTITTPVAAIQEGDVVGTCVHDLDRDDNEQSSLNLAGRNARGYSVQFADTSSDRCNTDSQVTVPNLVSKGDLSPRNSTVLHLYANIVSEEIEPTNTSTEKVTSLAEQATSVAIVTHDGNTNSDQSETTTNQDQSSTPGIIDAGALNIGAITSGLVILLLLISLSIIMIVVLTLLVVAKRKKKESYIIKHDAADNPNALGNAMYDQYNTDSVQLEASAYEIPVSTQKHESTKSSMELTHTYEYTSFDPHYEQLLNGNASESSVTPYESPLDSTAVSFSALLKKNQREDIYSDLQPFRPPSAHKDGIYEMIRACGIIDIPRSAIKSVGYLGSGQFANVEEGTWKKGVNKDVRVALKTMHDGSTEENKIKFLQEAAIMAQFRHPNVISLYGVVSKGDPVVLVTELMEKGDLRQYLNSVQPDPGELPPADLSMLLLIFSQQVALGMQYLAGKGFVHRDLAARNILVSENKICKVSDFGMSRDLADKDYYVAHRGIIPVKWTAPEALNYKKYSTASDVWSYGCLLYEIWSLGHKPFERISNVETVRLVDSGRRLPPPPGCPRMIYQLMILCWNPATSPRPSFRDVVLTLVGNQQLVLSIPQDAIETHQLAGVLGAPLEAGEKMYQDLQNTYVNQDGGTVEELDNDYEEFD